MERFGTKSAENLLVAIEQSKGQPLSRLLTALGIRHVGSTTARVLARHFRSLDKLAQATQEDLLAVPEIGEKIANAIVDFFAEPQNQRILQRLQEAGVNQLEPEEEGQPLAGKTFVLTGTLPDYSREQVVAMIEARGGKVTGSVSRKTDYVVVGDRPGSKYTRAQELGIPILNQEELLALLGVIEEE